MNLCAIFINRPIATSLLGVAISLFGILCFNLLPVAPLPQIEFPTIVVYASLSGASPEIMSTSVATPLERSFASIAGISDMTSSSNVGNSHIVIQFALERSIDDAAKDVEAAINATMSNLPRAVERPSYFKVNPADSPIMILGLTSSSLDPSNIYYTAQNKIQQLISKIAGVGRVEVFGSSLPAIRIKVDIDKLNKYGLSLDEVKAALNATNENSATGQISQNQQSYNIEIKDELFTTNYYEQIILAHHHEHILYLKDVALITNSVEDVLRSGILDNQDAVFMIVFKEPGANIIACVEKIYQSLPSFAPILEDKIKLEVIMDRTNSIKASLRDVEKTLIISMVLVALVIFYFLKTLKAAIIPSIAMSVSLLGTFVMMKVFGFSLNNLSLMALTISTGFVVDDAIVVLENISRLREEGLSAKEAALRGAKEISFTVIAISISLIVVFVPLIFMGGIVGRLFREFALTISIAIFISLLVSLSLTPMMCAKFLTLTKPADEFDRWKKFYAFSLKLALKHRRITLGITLLTIISSIYLFIIVPKGFFPQQDTGRIIGHMRGDQDISFSSLDEKLKHVTKIIATDEAIGHVVGFTNAGNTATVYIVLKNKRKVTSNQVIARINKKVKDIPGFAFYMSSAQELLIGARSGNAQFQYTVSGDTIEEVTKTADLIMKKVLEIKGVADVNSDQENKGLQTYVQIDYAKAAKFGISNKEIVDALYQAFGQSIAHISYENMNQYSVVLEIGDEFLQHPESLNKIYVKSASSAGAMIPLANIASFTNAVALMKINHQELSPAVTLYFNLLPNTALGDVVTKINDKVSELNLPTSVSAGFRGNAAAFKKSLTGELFLIIAALLAVYVMLGMLYESLIHPITIISSLPSAAVGAILALLVAKVDLNVISIIGIILLIGIVKKNAIMMIDFALEIEKSNNNPLDAIYQAAMMRFRPIMMTTICALLGALPLVFDTGVGHEIRRPLGITIAGGLILSQALTLYTTPVVYLYMSRIGRKNA